MKNIYTEDLCELYLCLGPDGLLGGVTNGNEKALSASGLDSAIQRK